MTLPINVRLETFEGPLDLLLYLIQTHELDISRISVTKITDQYLSYVRLMQELNFDLASEYLVIAATLIHWKSKSLLPQEDKGTQTGADIEDGPLSEEDLIRQLLEHQRFKAAGADLARLPLLGDHVFTRPNGKPPIERVWKTMDVTSIALSYQDMLTRARKRTQILKKETVSLKDRIIEFADRLEVGKPCELTKLLSAAPSRPEIVVTFLASLELARLKKMRLYQQKTYEEIYLELLESLKGFNVDLASGFEAEVTASVMASAPAPAPAPMA